ARDREEGRQARVREEGELSFSYIGGSEFEAAGSDDPAVFLCTHHTRSPSWPGLTRPSTSSLRTTATKDVDARHKAGHDEFSKTNQATAGSASRIAVICRNQ